MIQKNVFQNFFKKSGQKITFLKKAMYRKPSKIKTFKRWLCKVHNFEPQYQSLL